MKKIMLTLIAVLALCATLSACTKKKGEKVIDRLEGLQNNMSYQAVSSIKMLEIKEEFNTVKNLSGGTLLNQETVSEKDKVWVEKCRDGIDNYTDLDDNFGEYYKNFTEIDARKAGCKINKFVKGIAFDFESLRNNVLLKYFT